MPLDTSIPLSVRPAQVMGPAEAISLQNLSRQSQLGDLQLRQAMDADRESQLMKQLYTTPGAVDAKGMPTDETIRSLYAINPTLAGKMAQERAKALRDAHGAISPKDYTDPSFAEYVRTGDPTVLRPRTKMEHVTGVGPNGQPMTQFYDPYNPPKEGAPQPLPGFLGQLQALGIMQPGMEKDPRVQTLLSGYLGKETGQITAKDAADLQIKLAHLKNEGIGLGMRGAELQFNTGMKPTGGGVGAPNIPGPFNLFGTMPLQSLPGAAPAVTATPGNVPLSGIGTPAAFPQPQAAPRPTPAPQVAPRPVVAAPSPTPATQMPGATSMPPKYQAEVAKTLAVQKGEMEQKRDFNMQGVNAALDEAEAILTGRGGVKAGGVRGNSPLPTASGIGSLVDSAASFVGYAPDGAAQADQLRSIGGALVAKMPRMEGPQSDKDVALYTQMAGQIGDSSMPISRRLEALKTVRQLYAKYEKNGTQGAAAAPASPASDIRSQADAILGR